MRIAVGGKNDIIWGLPKASASLDLAARFENMSLSPINLILAMGPPPAGTQQNPKAQLMNTVVMMGFFFIVFYFVLIRPQSKMKKDHEELMKTLKAGDKVQTSGGIVGIVLAVKDNSVSIRSADSKLEVVKSAITAVTKEGAGTAQS